MTLLVGLLLGLAVGWIVRGLRRGSGSTASALEAELRQQAIRRETETQEWQTRAANAQAAAAAAEAARDAALREAKQAIESQREKETESVSLRNDLAQTQNRLATATAEGSAAKANLVEQQRVHEESERNLRETHTQWVTELRNSQEKALHELKQSFAGLSADALKQNGPEFLRLANETFTRFQESAKGDLSLREQRIESLVKPLEDQLKVYQTRLQQSESCNPPPWARSDGRSSSFQRTAKPFPARPTGSAPSSPPIKPGAVGARKPCDGWWRLPA